MAKNSVLVPASYLTPQARASIVKQNMELARSVFSTQWPASQGDQVVVRMAEPDIDFQAAGGSDFDLQSDNPGALTADTEATYISYDITNIQKVIVFYGVSNLSANPSIMRVRFKQGASPGTSVLASYYLANLYDGQPEVTGFFEEPLVYYKRNVLVRVTAPDAVSANVEKLVFHAFVAELYGDVVTQAVSDR